MDHYTGNDGLDPLRDPAPRRPSRRIMSRSGARPHRAQDPGGAQPELASSGHPRQSVVRKPSHSSQLSHNENRSISTQSHRDEEYSLISGDVHSRQSHSIGHPQSMDQDETRLPKVLEEDDRFVSGSSTVQPDNVDSIKFQIRQLKQKGFSTGLARELATNTLAFAYRIWVVDNSGSMQIEDGHRISLSLDGKIKQQRVSRWEELKDTVLYHSEMAATLDSPTVFRLLNEPGPEVGPQEYQIRPGSASDDIRKLGVAMDRAEPLGMTPLTTHIRQIQEMLHRMAPQLRREGKRVALILATDGLPTDNEGYGGEEITNEFVQALQSMEGLPIWLVIRLCTDEEKVTEFYNNLDGRFELSLEVLDDFLGEAAEVYQHNKWLNYSLPLHRCRELGYHDRLFDLIDERPLTKGELRDFCALLFGVDIYRIPDPNIDWKGFIKFVQDCLAQEPNQYDPIKKKILPLIHIRVLHKKYGKGEKCSIM